MLSESMAWGGGAPSEGSGQAGQALPTRALHSLPHTYSKAPLVLGSGNIQMPVTRLQPSSSRITNGHGPGLCPYLPS